MRQSCECLVLVMLWLLAACSEDPQPGADSDADADTDARIDADAEIADAEADADTGSVDEGSWDIGGTSLRYRIVGSGSPVILLHGGPGGNLLGWELAEELADTYQLIMYDQRGSGESERLPLAFDNQDRTLMSVERHVADLEEIREQILGLEQLVIIGHSWGSTLATFYAAEHPDRIERLILYNGGPRWTALSDLRLAEQERRMTPEQLDEVQHQLDRLNANIATWTQDELDEWFVEMVPLIFPTMVCDPEIGPTGEVGRGGFWANYLTNQYENTFDPDAFRPSLELVEAPALVTWGRCEISPIELHTFLRDALPEATMVIFEQSGHQALFEQHELFMDTVRAFLADQPLPLPAYTD